MIDAFNDPNKARERGIYFNEANYTCLRSDEDSIYAREVLEISTFWKITTQHKIVQKQQQQQQKGQ